jgi:hypothetical protein
MELIQKIKKIDDLNIESLNKIIINIKNTNLFNEKTFYYI